MIYTTNLKRKSDLSIRDHLSTLDKWNSNKNLAIFFYFCLGALQVIMFQVWFTYIVILLVPLYIAQATLDYWHEDFDDTKNCAREKEMKELGRETEPARCASAAKSGIL